MFSGRGLSLCADKPKFCWTQTVERLLCKEQCEQTVIVCALTRSHNFIAFHNKVQQDFDKVQQDYDKVRQDYDKVQQDYDNVTRSLITTWGMLAIYKLKLNFAWYFCVSAVCTIVFTNSHSAGRANMYRQYMYSQLIHFMPRGFKMAISKHLPEQPYLLSQCQYCSRWRRPTHGK